MTLDPAFRARLREAMQRLPKRGLPRPIDSPTADPSNRDEPYYEPVDQPDPVFNDAEDSGHGRGEAWIADVLGGWWRRDEHGVCLVVDRHYDSDFAHGSRDVGDYAQALARYRAALCRVSGDVEPPPPSDSLFTDDEDVAPSGVQRADPSGPLLFFDLETTGLNGGAGTCAFLVGFGWFEGNRFRTRQYFLSGFGHEPAMLRMAGEQLRATPAQPALVGEAGQPAWQAQEAVPLLTTYNGRTFDLPLIENRYLMNRVTSPFADVAHLDLLHPARRLWRYRPRARGLSGGYEGQLSRLSARVPSRQVARARAFDFTANAAGCTLADLEQAILGVHRVGDVPGGEIPTRFFHYVRSGDVRPLEPVLAHNRYDLLSLAALTGVVAQMIEEGPQAARNAYECVALGRLFERTGAGHRAADCYERAVSDDGGDEADPVVLREALRRLACRHRRDARHDDAAVAWQRLLDLSALHGTADGEALHALAVHHEHRARNFDLARAYVERLLAITADVRGREALRHRLERIERKQARVDRQG